MATECIEDVSGVSVDVQHDRRARWKIALHEAGHATAAKRLLGRKVTALVFDNDYGAAYDGGDGDCPKTRDEAVMIAAGKAAEALAGSHAPPPHVAPALPLTISHPETATVLLEDIKTKAVSDAVKLARWSIMYVEDVPYRWARNYYWLMDQAESFIRDHQREIVETATALYGRGIITLPAEPAQKGEDHVE